MVAGVDNEFNEGAAVFTAVFAAVFAIVKVMPRRRLEQANQPPRCKRFNAAYH